MNQRCHPMPANQHPRGTALQDPTPAADPKDPVPHAPAAGGPWEPRPLGPIPPDAPLDATVVATQEAGRAWGLVTPLPPLTPH